MECYKLPNFSLEASETLFGVRLTMELHIESFTTGFFPGTYLTLSRELPRIFKSRCFNEGNLPFRLEVQNTEMGHLFEHILLEYLCQTKLSQGFSRAVFKGETWWDWRISQRGTYYIDIQYARYDKKLFTEALEKTIKLFSQIISPTAPSVPLIKPIPVVQSAFAEIPVSVKKGGNVSGSRYNK